MAMFAALRHELLVQRAQIAERLAALDEAEQALVRVRRVFGLEDAAQSAQDAPGKAIAVDRPIVPTDPPSLATAPEEPANIADRPCAACGKPLPTTKSRGTPRAYCNTRCRQKAWAQRKAEQEAEADRAQAAAIVGQHAAEGYETLKWRNPNGTA
jgi:endogenous inhibitor of DNA gyrase (YacG/DUF329 family)